MNICVIQLQTYVRFSIHVANRTQISWMILLWKYPNKTFQKLLRLHPLLRTFLVLLLIWDLRVIYRRALLNSVHMLSFVTCHCYSNYLIEKHILFVCQYCSRLVISLRRLVNTDLSRILNSQFILIKVLPRNEQVFSYEDNPLLPIQLKQQKKKRNNHSCERLICKQHFKY